MENNKLTLLNIRQVAQYLNLSVATIDRLLSSKEFVEADFLVSNVRKRLWRLESINGYLSNKCKNPKLTLECTK